MPRKESSWPNGRLALAAFIVSLGGGFNFGYQLLITNPAEDAFKSFLTKSYNQLHDAKLLAGSTEIVNLWGIILAMFFWGATVGAFLIQIVSEKMGRKYGLVFSFIAQAVSIIMAIGSYYMENYILYTVSRAICGAAISISIGIAPIFITECSPAHCRGTISLATAIMMQLALVVGAVVAMPQHWGQVHNWHYMYIFELALLVPAIIGTLIVKESPCFLASQGKKKEAIESFEYYHGVRKAEAEGLLDSDQKSNENEQSIGLFSIFKNKNARRGMLVGSVVMIGMIMSGIIAINAFAFKFLIRVGFTPLYASIGNTIICIMTVFGVILSSLFIEKYGRRSLLLITFVLLAIFNIAIFVCMLLFEKYQTALLGWGVVIGICIFNLIFSAGPCPIAFFVTGELVSQAGRAAACTWVIVLLNLLRSVVLVIYNPLENILGGPTAYFGLFFPPCIIAAGLLYFYLPETKGKTPEEAAADCKNLPRLTKNH